MSVVDLNSPRAPHPTIINHPSRGGGHNCSRVEPFFPSTNIPRSQQAKHAYVSTAPVQGLCEDCNPVRCHSNPVRGPRPMHSPPRLNGNSNSLSRRRPSNDKIANSTASEQHPRFLQVLPSPALP